MRARLALFSCEVEVDESYFGARRVRGRGGRGALGKTIVFGIFKRNGCVYTEVVADCKKATLQAIIRGRVSPEAVELWTQDEARLGLKPVTRGVWSPKGERPTAHTRPAYEWLWLFAAVHPASGRVFWLVLPYLNAQMM